MATINVAPSASHISHNLRSSNLTRIQDFFIYYGGYWSRSTLRHLSLISRIIISKSLNLVDLNENTRYFIYYGHDQAPPVSHISNYYFEMVEFKLS